MTAKKIVLCDADDVIEKLCETWISYLNSHYGTRVNIEDVTGWDMCEFFPELTRDQVFSPVYKKEFWNLIQPVKGCYDVLSKINDKHELYIVTATNYQICDVKVERIFKMYPFLKWSQFIITERKQLIFGDWLIDDGVHNFDGGIYKGILFDRPHNRSFNEKDSGLIRVYTWDEIGKILL